MSKPLSYSAWKSSAVCRRCGNRMQSHERCCDLCGAFNFAEISYQRGPASSDDRLSRGNADVRLPLNLAPGAVPPDFQRYEARSYPSSARIRGRTLSLKAALLIACAVGLLAGGLTYLRFGTSSVESEPAYDARPVARTDVDTRSDDPASVAYMSPKAMHDIQDMLNDSHISGSQAATVGHPPPAISRADVQQLSVATPAFSDSHDPDALELAIKQYGWKPDPHTKTSR